MYIKAPLVVLLLSAIPSLALPVDSDAVTARFASADSSIEARNPGCIQRARRACAHGEPGCIQKAKRACAVTVDDEQPAQEDEDVTSAIEARNPGCIQKAKRACAKNEPGCIQKAKRACAIVVEPVDPQPETKRACASPNGCIQEEPAPTTTAAAGKRACASPDGCIQKEPAPPTTEERCIQQAGKRACDKL